MSRPTPLTRAAHLAAAALLFLGWQGPAAAREASGEEAAHVLVVAHNASLDNGVKPLRFADDDGARYFELFRAAGARVSLLSVLDPDTARVHPEAARAARVPWAATLREEVARIRAAVERDRRAGRLTRFTFIYVGHGNVANSGEGYVNLQDRRLYRSDLFRDVIEQVPADTIHLVIDACKSYFLIARGPSEWRDDRSGHTYRETVRAFLARGSLERHPHVGAIVSTSGDEEVHEWSAFRSGVFSHQLRSALTGAADINGDGKVAYSEVAAFIAAANFRVRHQRARLRPFVQPPAARRDAALMDLRSVQRRGLVLDLSARRTGRFSVEDERGVRHADLNKAAGAGIRLALSSHHRYYIRHGDREATLPRGRRGIVPLASLPEGPARSAPRGAVDAAFRTDLFGMAFSRSFYEGFVALTDLPAVAFDAGVTGAAPPRFAPARWRLHLGYALSGGAVEGYDGVHHNVALGASRQVWGPLYLALGAELGTGSRRAGTLDSRVYRLAVLGGAGLRFAPWPWLDLGVQADVGYQALVLTEQQRGGDDPALRQTSTSPAGMKVGSKLLVNFRPLPAVPGLGVTLSGGLYGYMARVQDRTTFPLVPEGGAGVSYSF